MVPDDVSYSVLFLDYPVLFLHPASIAATVELSMTFSVNKLC